MAVEERARRIGIVLVAAVLGVVAGLALIQWLGTGDESTLPGGPPATDAPLTTRLPTDTAPSDDDTTRATVNEFLPEERSLSECISALPKPGCGSEARGGWRQTAVLVAILAGLAFIVWRIVRSARRARAGASAGTQPTE